MPHITSRDNPLLKRLRKLLTSGSERREQGLIVLDGPHLLQAYLQSHGATGVQVVVAQSSRRDDAEIVRLADQVETVIEVGDALIGTLSPSNTPVGVVALAPMPVPSQRVAGDCVLIECVQDPGTSARFFAPPARQAFRGCTCRQDAPTSGRPNAYAAAWGRTSIW